MLFPDCRLESVGSQCERCACEPACTASFTRLAMTLGNILDEDAEVFVVKMWRLLIYESEAKKLGLVVPRSAQVVVACK
ncbi:hypothetical protein COOONC_19630 [Cooperia oncophora]